MRFVSAAAAAFFSLLAAVPAYADRDCADPLEAQVMLNDIVTEQDVSMLFDYVRSAMFAASQGFEVPPPPPELGQRAEAIGNALKARGALTALMLLNALELSAKQALRDSPPAHRLPPPSVPYTPLTD